MALFVGPAASALLSSTTSPRRDETAKFLAIAASVVGAVALIAALAFGVACCSRRLGCPLTLPPVVDGRRAARKRRRVVVMHSNSLYDGDATAKHQHPHPHQQQHQQQPLSFVMPPRVKIETGTSSSTGRGGSRRRLLSTVLEYDIPLDPQWEFPRDKYAAA